MRTPEEVAKTVIEEDSPFFYLDIAERAIEADRAEREAEDKALRAEVAKLLRGMANSTPGFALYDACVLRLGEIGEGEPC